MHYFQSLEGLKFIFFPLKLDKWGKIYNYAYIMKEYTKKERQQLLKKVIVEQEIGDQLHLLEELKKHGIEATQATISRDLQEMGIAKIRIKPGIFKYEVIDKVPEGVLWKRLKILFENFVYDIKSTGKLILLKTSPGNAHGVASLIDHLNREEILGTIAGDDTIMVVVDTQKNRVKIESEFQELLDLSTKGIP
jgi:transcriptional regulator of arginine metabolism